MTTLVVRGDGNIDELGWGVGIAKGDDGDVDVRGFLDSLGVGARVGDDDQAGLLERAGDVIGEVTGGETTSNGDSTSVCGKLEDSTLAVGASGDDDDIGWVVDRCNNSGRKNNFLPKLNVSIEIMIKTSSWW